MQRNELMQERLIIIQQLATENSCSIITTEERVNNAKGMLKVQRNKILNVQLTHVGN